MGTCWLVATNPLVLLLSNLSFGFLLANWSFGFSWPTFPLISCWQTNPISSSCPTNVQCILFAADFQISSTYIDFVPTLAHLVSPFQILKPSPFPNSTSSMHQGLQDSWVIYTSLKSTKLLKETFIFKSFFLVQNCIHWLYSQKLN